MDIEIKGLKKSYFPHKEEIPVLQSLSFAIKKGDMISLTGPSGVGKSTLLHILGTLDTPTAGEVLFDNQNVFEQTSTFLAHFRSKNIGFVFQFHHLLPEFSALENVKMPLLIRGCSQQQAGERAMQWLEQVGLAHRLRHRPQELSGGEQQRVALARALVSEPRLLLADEPTGNLDESTGGAIVELIQRMNREFGITVFMVTHQVALAKKASRQMILKSEGLFEASLSG